MGVTAVGGAVVLRREACWPLFSRIHVHRTLVPEVPEVWVQSLVAWLWILAFLLTS